MLGERPTLTDQIDWVVSAEIVANPTRGYRRIEEASARNRNQVYAFWLAAARIDN